MAFIVNLAFFHQEEAFELKTVPDQLQETWMLQLRLRSIYDMSC